MEANSRRARDEQQTQRDKRETERGLEKPQHSAIKAATNPPSDADPPPSPERSALMARITSKDTKPEMAVRRLLHAMGYRYRLHRRNLPGSPDISFASRRKAIFVHGCFWHRHEGCRRTTTPTTRRSYWEQKFERNVLRDRKNLSDLGNMEWESLVVWECETTDLRALARRLASFLSGRKATARLQRLDGVLPPPSRARSDTALSTGNSERGR